MRKSVEKAMEQVLLAEWLERRAEISSVILKELCKDATESSDCGVPICKSCQHQAACTVFLRALYN